jgi:hypothetical protein
MTGSPARVTGPVSGGNYGWPFGASILDLDAYGYEEHEYFLEGEATRFRQVPNTPWGPDGLWHAEAVDQAPFKTRFIVYRPRDAARFNGTVVVIWNNVTAGHDLFGAGSRELFDAGFAVVCLTTQKVGIDGLPPIHQGLAGWDDERYGSLTITSDDYAYDVFTQAARAVGPNRKVGEVDPMGGLEVHRVIAQGASQSAGRLATYINAIQPLARAYDGFILTIYFGRGTPLEVGETVVDLDAPAEGRDIQNQLRGENRLRDDLGTPIFVVNSELEALACHNVRQADTDTFRYWECAGTSHGSQQGRAIRQLLIDRDQVVSRPAVPNINAIPMGPLFDIAHHHMHRWLAEGSPPPIQPKIEFSGNPVSVVRDEHGIAKGGIRLPQADVPLAQNSAIPLAEDIFALLGGSSHPFAADQVIELYGDLEQFIARFEAAAEQAVDAGVLPVGHVVELVKEARTRWPG